MTANRGPEPWPDHSSEHPVFNAEWWAKQYAQPYVASPQTPSPEPEFTGIEMERLMSVKPTPYLDEADRIDPTWRLLDPKPDRPAGYTGGMLAWWRWMFGTDPP